MAFDSKWAHDEDRCYHGIQREGDRNQILVEETTSGWTDRATAELFRQLASPDPVVDLHWGYDGSGPHRAAEAILIDALGWEPPRQVVHAFVMDWLCMASDEFWFRRPAILRWVRGLMCSMDLHNLRAPLAELPPVEHRDYAISPETLAKLEQGQQ
jgi:hypothetical protein